MANGASGGGDLALILQKLGVGEQLKTVSLADIEECASVLRERGEAHLAERIAMLAILVAKYRRKT